MKYVATILLILFCAFPGHAAAQNDLGGMEPAKALEYMKSAQDLVIVDVAARNGFAKIHFVNAINIPIENISLDEAKKLYMQIPTDRPVLLHCRLGMIVPGAYQTVKNLRPDIPEISYIAGKPPFHEYNTWHDGAN